jgi:septation ring formation regulator EzrA
VLGLAAGAGSLVGCHRTSADNAGQAAPKPDPDSVKQSFEKLKKEFADLQQSFSNLSKDVETIPANMQGYPQLRAHFYAVEEARGVTDAKVNMLASRLDAALRSGKRDELQQVSTEIDKASNDCRKIGALYLKLLHEVMAFQRVAEQRRPALAASGGAPSSAQTKRSKALH